MANMLDIQNLSAGYGAALVLHGVSAWARWSR
jgi:ABC-type branched-subunit amino acid transport system ATPase component